MYLFENQFENNTKTDPIDTTSGILSNSFYFFDVLYFFVYF